MKKLLILLLIIILMTGLTIGGYYYNQNKNQGTNSSNSGSSNSYTLNFDNTAWNYDSENNVYWQIGVVYCTNPETTEYESMGIYVPGDYFNGEKNADETYTCTINKEKTVGKYTAETAPIVMPIKTEEYSAQIAPTKYNYNGLSDYLNAGLIYVYVGCRGKDNGDNYSGGAPWGVTDLKAAVRYLKYNKEILPGNTERIFTFGHGGGGTQSSLMGATGDSKLYTQYLESIGAAMTDEIGNSISDSIYGAMCWCPITNLDYADEAYEWNMGQYANDKTRADKTWTSELSKDLADAYAKYINTLKLKDENGNTLSLEETEEGIYTSGSYYDYILSIIEKSLNNFITDTDKNITEYIAALNSDEEWIKYNEETKTAKISSIEAFVKHCKKTSKVVGAFDDLKRSQTENKLFGNHESNALHFDITMSNLLKNNESKYSEFSDWNSSYITEYENDIAKTDKLGNNSQYRQNMYNPMYFISNYYEGYGTSNVAKYWRIRTGIEQEDTALTVETNLSLALKQNKNVQNVDFETVWEQGHEKAERTGSSTKNFIEWIEECLK